jgi:bifunctional non-homologous end joining protein LigD
VTKRNRDEPEPAPSLGAYQAKRQFDRTPEPSGDSLAASDGAGIESGAATGRYVVQRHRARRLHYDFRLEIDGVLVSWAVPRGPSMDSAARRLAVQVEDHPLEYYDFEGVIPGGQYGAGDVIVWDWGRWTADPSAPDAAAALRKGELKFRLDGEKLEGAFVLIRTERWARSRPSKPKWLLIHRRNDDAIAGWDAEDLPRSVKTGRTNEDVAAQRSRRLRRPSQEKPSLVPG